LAENAENWFEYSAFNAWLLNQNGSSETNGQDKLLEKLVILADRDFSNLSFDQSKNEIIKTVRSLKDLYYSSLYKEKEKQIAEEERNGNAKEAERLFKELAELKEEKKNILNADE
jgi:hypothetical protein